MNTGLQDSYNLAWKLGLIMNKLAPATLLQSYHEERQPMADRAIALSSALSLRARDWGLVNFYMKRLFLILSPLLSKISITVFPPAANMVRTEEEKIREKRNIHYIFLQHALTSSLHFFTNSSWRSGTL